ncbi:MAG: radical SAM protein [Candidatus Wallbacteria bacterium]|nr:radical SAM protein [Candidatus Wallbacteria bacterium]
MKKDGRALRSYRFLDLTQGMCRKCRKIVDSQIIVRDGSVYQRNICPEHGESESMLARDAGWYLKVIESRQVTDRPKAVARKIDKVCPFDCGLCAWHEKGLNLPVFSITNACNLDCPICFTYNRNDIKYFMSKEEFGKIIENIVLAQGKVDLINITGGEPTLHPQLFDLLDLCRRPEIGRVTLNSNGLTLAQDESLVQKLSEYGIYVILSFNSFNHETTAKIHGQDILDQKMKALENLEKHGVNTTLLNVSIKNLNDREIGDVLKFCLSHDFIRNLSIQNMTYTGFGGKDFGPREHLPIDEVIGNICSAMPDVFTPDDFTPLPGSHPLCYSVCYFFHGQAGTFPLKRLFSNEEYRRLLGSGYLIRPDESFQELLNSKIGEIYANRDTFPEADKILKILRDMILRLFPEKRLSEFERQKEAEKCIKNIYIHSHMDEDNFDLSRIVRCGDLVPDTDGSFTPACSYNLFYRMHDERFWKKD